MRVQIINDPSWSEGIKETLSPYRTSFSFEGVPDDYSLDMYEWWEVVDEEGSTIGVGWIDIDKNFQGKIECEVSLCRNNQYTVVQGVGITLLKKLELEAANRKAEILSAVVKQSNPEHDQVVEWFKRRGYEINTNESSESNTCLKKVIK